MLFSGQVLCSSIPKNHVASDHYKNSQNNFNHLQIHQAFTRLTKYTVKEKGCKGKKKMNKRYEL